MAHKTLINGTSYEISGGKTLVNGTAYSIDKGKTLVGGATYNIDFVVLMYTFNLVRFDNRKAEVWMNGVQIQEVVNTQLREGTEIHFLVRGTANYRYIEFNSVRVGTVYGDETIYVHRLTSNIKIEMSYNSSAGQIKITEM